jgi:hypothetical protein
MARKKATKAGRPPKREGERLSKNRTFRVRGALDSQLQAAAEENERSVSEEIEYRLAQSFAAELARVVGGQHSADLIRAVDIAIWLVEVRTGKKWNADERTAVMLGFAIENLVLGLQRGGFTLKEMPSLRERAEEMNAQLPEELRVQSDALTVTLTILYQLGLAPDAIDYMKSTAANTNKAA